MECAEESLEWSTVRTLAKRVLPCDEHFVQSNGSEFLQWDGVAEDDDVDDDSLAFPWDPGRALAQSCHDEGGPDSFKIFASRGQVFRAGLRLGETRTRKAPVSSGIRPGSARRRALVKESAAPMKESACSVKELAAHVKEVATPSKSVARVPRVSPRPKDKAFCVCGWSEDAWDPTRAYILVCSFETTDERFEVEVPSTAVMDMSGVSGRHVCLRSGRYSGRQLLADTAR